MGVDATTSALLAFGSGATAAVQASFEAAPHQIVEVVGTDGVLRVPDAFSAGRDVAAPLLRDGVVVGTWRADAYELMVTAFAEAVAGGKQEAPLPIDDAVATAQVLDRIRAATV
jgi:D-xylose 1-dehydrogenase (NADP+, D-xylono-1,5-lactone-forming)